MHSVILICLFIVLPLLVQILFLELMLMTKNDSGAMMKFVISEIALMTWTVTENDIANLPRKQTPIYSFLSEASINIPDTVLLFNNCLLNEQKHE